MLVGTDDPQRLAEGAPEMPALDTEALELPGAVFLQALFEIESGAMCEMLPPALHPTLPPVAGVVAYDVPESPWGPFRIAQLRVQCRSGLRPRALLVSAVVDVPEVGEALAQRFGTKLISAHELVHTAARSHSVVGKKVAPDVAAGIPRIHRQAVTAASDLGGAVVKHVPCDQEPVSN